MNRTSTSTRSHCRSSSGLGRATAQIKTSRLN